MGPFVRIARSAGICAALAGAGLASAAPAHAVPTPPRPKPVTRGASVTPVPAPSPAPSTAPASGSSGESVINDRKALNLLVVNQSDNEVQRMRTETRGGGCNTHLKSHTTGLVLLGPITESDSSIKQCS